MMEEVWQISGEMELGQVIIYMGMKLDPHLVSYLKISILHEESEHQKQTLHFYMKIWIF